MDLESELARITAGVVHVGGFVAIEPHLDVVALGSHYDRVPVVSIDNRLVLVYCQEHLAGTVQRAGPGHRILVFEDVRLICLFRWIPYVAS